MRQRNPRPFLTAGLRRSSIRNSAAAPQAPEPEPVGHVLHTILGEIVAKPSTD